MRRSLVIGLIAFTLTAQVSAAPTVWKCYVTDGGWRDWNGKEHCELEGWRAYGNSWLRVFGK